jgi:dTDP-4-dehydrorhamnose reductase
MRLVHGISVADPTEQPPVARRSQASFGRAATPRPLVIVGATGTLGRAFTRICDIRGLAFVQPARRDLDISDTEAVRWVLDQYDPWAVVNAAGYVRVDDAERDADACHLANTEGPAVLAAACASRGVQLLTFSSDLVFDGSKGAPYVESDPVSPLNVYGRSKAEAEALVFHELPTTLVVRTSAFFGPWDEYNFVTLALRTLAEDRPLLAGLETVSPTYVPDLVNTCLDLLVDGESGIWHLANSGVVTWAELARLAAQAADLDPGLVREHPTRLAARRPAYTVLGSERGQLMPPLDDALQRYLNECEVEWKPARILLYR